MENATQLASLISSSEQMWGYPVTLLKTGSPGEVQSFVLKPELFPRTVFTWWLQNSPHKQIILLQITDHQQGHTQKETSLCWKHTLRMSVHAPNRRERCKTQESWFQCLIKTIPPLQGNICHLFSMFTRPLGAQQQPGRPPAPGIKTPLWTLMRRSGFGAILYSTAIVWKRGDTEPQGLPREVTAVCPEMTDSCGVSKPLCRTV